jgi:general secretion pathway protein M
MMLALAPWQRRAMALVLLLALVLLVGMIVVAPIVDAFASAAEQRTELSELLLRLRAAAREGPALQARVVELDRMQQQRADLFEGGNATLATASLQGEVKRIVESAGGQLRSLLPLPGVPDQQFQRLSVRVEFAADTAKLSRILYDIEAHRPTLLVNNLAVRASEQAGATAAQGQLQIRLDVSAFASGAG